HLDKPHMPPLRDKLPEDVIAQLAAWVDGGAPYGPARPAVSTTGAGLFAAEIRPLLETNCIKCHNASRSSSGLDLTKRASLLRGGDRGPAVIPGNGKGSLLYQAIAHTGKLQMPFQADKLPESAIARIADWIDQGAQYAAPRPLRSKGAGKPTVDHGAFKVPTRPAVPVVRNSAWVRNPVDAFIAAEHEKRGLQPAPPAEKRTLLRRVYLDLTG